MNRFAIDENDPRLTAYALGEMPAAEAAEFEKQIAGEASLVAAIAEIRQTATLLRAEFTAEPSPGLGDAHHRAMEQRMLHGDDADAPRPIPITRGRWINRILLASAGLAAAACLAIAFVLPMKPGKTSISDVAINKDQSKNAENATADRPDRSILTFTQNGANESGDSRRTRELADKAALKAAGEVDGDRSGQSLRGQAEDTKSASATASLGKELQPIAGSPVSLGGKVEGAAGADPQPTGSGGSKKTDSSPPAAVVAETRQAGQSIAPVTETKQKSPSPSGNDSLAAANAREGGMPPDSAVASASPSASPAPPPPPQPEVGRLSDLYKNLSDKVNPEYAGGGGGVGGGGTIDESRNQVVGDREESPSNATGPKVDLDSLTQAIVTAPQPQPSGPGAAADSAGSSGGRGLGARGHVPARSARPSAPSAPPGFYPTEASIQALRQQIYSLSPEQARATLAQVVEALRRAGDQDQVERLRLCQRMLAERVQSLGPNTENYKVIRDNPFVRPIGQAALSTFGADVDTASYSNIRRFIEQQGQLPPRDAVRIEELLNYFTYAYEPPSQEKADAPPFSTNVEINAAPWNPSHRLVRIGLKAKEIRQDMRPPTSLVFLIDVSGSMQPANKLPLIKQALHLLVDRLNGDDMLGIVTYAGNAGLVKDSTYVNPENKADILAKIDGLSAGGSTNGAGGLVMAYDLALQHFIKGGVNRVILCTDGDFNVGVSGEGELIRLIEQKRESKVFLSVMGFGSGNLQDAKMEGLANHGNGEFAYIDGLDEARKVFVDQMAGTLVPIAKDVKFQVEFNPAKVAAYRQIGYENRKLAAQDFNNDRKDAGEIGAGHSVTVLYEVVPPGVSYDNPGDVDALKYQQPATKPEPALAEPARPASDELLTVKLRFKQPDEDVSKLLEIPVKDAGNIPEMASADFMFASSVAAFGMVLRESPYRGTADLQSVLDWAQAGRGDDPKGYRTDFIRMVEKARLIPSAGHEVSGSPGER